jgi:hypothetical protein
MDQPVPFNAAKHEGTGQRERSLAMPRTKFRPHGEARHEEGGGDRWSLALFDWDPVRGLIPIIVITGITFAATIAVRELYEWVLGDGDKRPTGGDQP